MRRRIYLGVLALAAVFSAVSCKKDDGNTTNVTPNTGELVMHFHGKAGGNNLALDKEFKLSDGTRVKFEKVFFYASGLKLKNNMDGSGLTEIKDQFHLVNPNQMMYSVGQVAAQNYHGLMFDIGVDKTTNTTKEPSNFAPEHALGPKDPSMYWSWSNGYRFMLIEGMVDISPNNDGALDQKFQMHVGTNEMLRSVDSKMFHFEVKGGQKKEIMIDYDVLKIFEGIDLKKTENRSTHTMNNKPLAVKTIENATGMFSFK